MCVGGVIMPKIPSFCELNGGSTQSKESSLSSKECKALNLLHDDGYTYGELSMMFGLCDSNIGPHINGNCHCEYRV